MADRNRRVGKGQKCKVVLQGGQKGTKFGNFCGMPLNAEGKCPEHGSKTK